MMKQKIKIYGIKNCGSVQKGLRFLESRGLDFEFVDFKITPPSKEDITRWLNAFGEATINTKGMTYKKLQLSTQTLDTNAKINLMCQHPTLIKRPIIEVYHASQDKGQILKTDSCIIGFDEAKYAEIFG